MIIELKINKICWWNILFLELTKTKEIKNPKKLTKKPDITHKNKELIIVDDDLSFRNRLSRSMENKGFKVEVFSKGRKINAVN